MQILCQVLGSKFYYVQGSYGRLEEHLKHSIKVFPLLHYVMAALVSLLLSPDLFKVSAMDAGQHPLEHDHGHSHDHHDHDHEIQEFSGNKKLLSEIAMRLTRLPCSNSPSHTAAVQCRVNLQSVPL